MILLMAVAMTGWIVGGAMVVWAVHQFEEYNRNREGK